MHKQQRLIEQLLRATETMVQGGLSETSRRCGNPGCACYRAPQHLHGPHLYITYREDGKSALYTFRRSMPKPPPGTASLGRLLEDWVFLAALNREQLRQQWQQEKKAGAAASEKRGSRD